MVTSGRNLRALNRTLKTVGGFGDQDAAALELVRSLARAVDGSPGRAALWEQYRAALKELLADDRGDEFEKLLPSLNSGAAVGDTSSG